MAKDTTDPSLTRMLPHLIAARDLLLTGDPGSTSPMRARMGVATALRALGADAEAIALYDSVLADHPSHRAAAKARAEAVQATGRTEAVEPERNPRPDPATQLDLARSHLKRGDFAAAQELFERVLAADLDNQPAQVGCVDTALRAGDLSRAEALARNVLERLPGNIPFGLRLAESLQRQGRITEALDLFEDMQRRAPDHPRTGISLARACLKAGRLSETRDIAERMLADTPTSKDAWLLRIDAARAAGDLDEMLRCCNTALQYHADAGMLLDRKAYALTKAARPLEALLILERLSVEAPDNSPLHARMAGACLAAGQTDDARRILELAPASDPVTLARADLEEQAGDLDLAIQRLAQIVDATEGATSGPTTAVVLKFCTLCLRAGQVERARDALAAAKIDTDSLPSAQLLQLMQVAARLGDEEITVTALDSALSREAIPQPLAMHVLRMVHSAGMPDLTARVSDGLASRVAAVRRADFWIESDALTLGPEAAIVRAQATRTARRDPPAARALAGALLQAGRRGLLLRYLSFCRRRWPSDLEFAIRMAEALGAFGQPQAAMAVLDEISPRGTSPNLLRRRLHILYESARLAEAEHVLETAGVPPAALLSPILRMLLNIGRDRIDRALALEPELARQVGRDHATMSRFSTTHIGALLNEAKIYCLARGQQPSLAQTDAESLQRSFFLPAKQAIDRIWQGESEDISAIDHCDIPQQAFQYWDADPVPDEVAELMSSWQRSEGYCHHLMNRAQARAFLRKTFDADHERAFRLANHVAEECDFLRLCLLSARGGVYADADDRLIGDLEILRRAGRGMVLFREPVGAIANNLILARPGHPLLKIAVNLARDSLLARENDNTWSKTGPGLLTRATAVYLAETPPDEVAQDFTLLPRHLAQRVVQFHVKLPYKSTRAHWNSTAGLPAQNLLERIEQRL